MLFKLLLPVSPSFIPSLTTLQQAGTPKTSYFRAQARKPSVTSMLHFGREKVDPVQTPVTRHRITQCFDVSSLPQREAFQTDMLPLGFNLQARSHLSHGAGTKGRMAFPGAFRSIASKHKRHTYTTHPTLPQIGKEGSQSDSAGLGNGAGCRKRDAATHIIRPTSTQSRNLVAGALAVCSLKQKQTPTA